MAGRRAPGPGADLDDLLRLNQYMGQTPHALQIAFMSFWGLDAFIGGAGGPGKSSGLLLSGLQGAEEEHYDALIVRKTFTALKKPGALMSRAREWLGPTDAEPIDSGKMWRFPGGATLSFGHCEDASALDAYASSEFQYIALDEAGQFTPEEQRFFFGRLRKTRNGCRLPLRFRRGSNPGGPGHQELKESFVDKYAMAMQGLHVPDTVIDLGGGYKVTLVWGVDTVFFPGKIADNRHLELQSYLMSIAHLPDIMRARILHGDWEISEGGVMFQKQWFANRRVDAIPSECRRFVRYWDLAATEPSKKNRDPDWTAGALVTAHGGRTYILDVRRMRGTPGDVEDFMVATAEEDVAAWGGDGYEVHWEEEGGSAGKFASRHLHNRLRRWRRVSDRKTSGDGKISRAGPVASDAKAGNLYLYNGPPTNGQWIPVVLGELELLGTGDAHDDMADGISGAYVALHGKATDRAPVSWLERSTPLPGRPPADPKLIRVQGPGRPRVWRVG